MFGYRILAAGAAALLISGMLSGQDAPPAKVTEPEYNFVVFVLDSTTEALVPLERKQANVQAKVRAMGFGGVKGSTVYPGESSPVRFKESQKLQFVVRLESGGMDPSTLIGLESLTRSRGKRELQTMQVSAFGHAGTTNGQSSQSLNFAKYGEHSYRFTPADPLPKASTWFRRRGRPTDSCSASIDAAL